MGGGKAIGMFERGIPRKYWSKRGVAGEGAMVEGVDAASGVG